MVRLTQHELEAQGRVMAGHPLWLVRSPETVEQMAIEQFVLTATSLELAPDSRDAARRRVLGATEEMARAVDLSRSLGSVDRYGRRVLERWWVGGGYHVSVRAGQLRRTH